LLSFIFAGFGLVFAQKTDSPQKADWEKRLAEGRTRRALGRYIEAEQVFKTLLREVEGGGHDIFVASVLDNLALTEQDLGNFMAAESLLTRSLSILKKTGGAAEARVADVEGQLGEVYLEEGRPREAEPLFRRALEIRQNAPQPDAAGLSVSMADLAMVYKSEGKFHQAEALLLKALALLEERFGPDDPMVASALGPLGATLIREGRKKEALAVTERTWEILHKDPRVAEPDLINTMNTLGMLYSLAGRFQEAEFFGREAVVKAETVYGPEHPRLGWHLANYAQILKRMGRKGEARAVEQRSAAILADSRHANPVRDTVNVNALR
jgi:tetratricopeptide (TPR) repeat protein